MTTKWAFPEVQNFDDMVESISKRQYRFEFLKERYAQEPIAYWVNKTVRCRNPMSVCNILTNVLYRTDNWRIMVNFEQVADLLGLYNIRLHEECIGKIDIEGKSVFEEGKEYFERNREFLTKQYEGQYIAIWKNEIIAHDNSFSSLAKRVYEKLGYVAVYMPYVTSKRRVLRFESPKYKQRRANVS